MWDNFLLRSSSSEARRIRASQTFPLFHLLAVNSSSSPLKTPPPPSKSPSRRIHACFHTYSVLSTSTSITPTTNCNSKKAFFKTWQPQSSSKSPTWEIRSKPPSHAPPSQGCLRFLVSKVQHRVQKFCMKLLFQSRLPANLSSWGPYRNELMFLHQTAHLGPHHGSFRSAEAPFHLWPAQPSALWPPFKQLMLFTFQSRQL